MKTLFCPGCHKKLVLRKLQKETHFRGIRIIYEAQVYVCPACGLEAGTIESAGAVQRAIADSYRKQMHLLTGRQIKTLRESKGWSHEDLAGLLDIPSLQVVRWESGLIQSDRMDGRLRAHLAARSL